MQLCRILEVLSRRVVGGKHDVASGEAARFGHHQLGQRGAIDAAALLLQNLQNERIRRRLYRKIFLEALVPCECLLEIACTLADALLVIQVERRRIFFDNFLQLFIGDKWLFHLAPTFLIHFRAAS